MKEIRIAAIVIAILYLALESIMTPVGFEPLAEVDTVRLDNIDRTILRLGEQKSIIDAAGR